MHRVLYRLLMAIVTLLARSDRDKDHEIIALRHQPMVLRSLQANSASWWGIRRTLLA